MDINNIGTVSEDEGTFVHFRDPAGELLYDGDGEAKTPVGAVVAGSYSKVYKKAQKQIADRNMRERRRGKEFTADVMAERELDLQAACILSWTFTSGDQPFPVTVANWSALAAKQPQWQEQVERAIEDHARFFAGSSPV